MILDVHGLFAGKWIKLKYRIPREILESKLEDGSLFDYETVEEFIYEHTFEDSLVLLKRYPDDIEMVSGGRLDIIARTKADVLFELSDFKLERDNLTLLERLIEVLTNIEDYPVIEEYVEMCVSIHNVGDAVSILKAKRI